ncbi:MAG: AI-2E family transporter [Phycisphaerae bacterium]|nr:AI-2E family transporter [Saprospiraceae bacterium]
MDKSLLSNTIKVLLFFILSTCILFIGREFLIPVALAGVLAILLIPMNRWLERKGANRGVASICCVLALILAIGGLFALLAWQMSSFAEDLGQVKEQASNMLNKLRQFISDSLGISPEKQQEMMEKQQSSGGGDASKMVGSVLSALMGISVNTILVLVYIFLFLYFRNHFKKFILMLVPAAKKAETEIIIQESSQVVQKYLSGLATMILILWVMYGIGFSIAGVKHALFFAVLCGLLEIVPFVGNITGTAVTVLVSLAQGGDTQLIVGILIVYALVQFIQTYVLEPLVVGAEVNINPVFTILSLVAAEMVWGIGGMVLAIPLLGIVKIVCDHVEPLKPYGFLLGSEPKKKKSGDWVKRVKGWFK